MEKRDPCSLRHYKCVMEGPIVVDGSGKIKCTRSKQKQGYVIGSIKRYESLGPIKVKRWVFEFASQQVAVWQSEAGSLHGIFEKLNQEWMDSSIIALRVILGNKHYDLEEDEGVSFSPLFNKARKLVGLAVKIHNMERTIKKFVIKIK